MKREGMKLWNKLKNGKAQLTEITKELTRLRDRLTRAEGVSEIKHYLRNHSRSGVFGSDQRTGPF